MRSALVFTLLATGVAGVAGVPQRPSAPPAPARASAAFTRLFDQYRHGDAGAAIRAFAQWKAERVEAEALRPGDVDVKDTTTLEALALLHTDAGIVNGRFGLFSDKEPAFLMLDAYGLNSVFEVHSRTAFTIVDSLAERGKATHDAALLHFAKSWYVVALSVCAGVELPTQTDIEDMGVSPESARQSGPPAAGARGAPGARGARGGAARPDAPPDNTGFHAAGSGKAYCADGLSDKARHDFSDDAEIMLALGTVREPREMTQADVADMHVPFDLKYGAKALDDFDDALRLDPALSEARLRKGHLLHIARNEPGAVPLLEQALEEARAARNEFVRYLAALFLGEVQEDAGDLDAAIPYYREAVTVARAHTASIALGQALIRTGRVAEGWAVGARMYGREGMGADPVLDPWVQYPRAEYWQVDDRLGALRDKVRGR